MKNKKTQKLLLIFGCICIFITLLVAILTMCVHSVRFAIDNAPVYTPKGVANNYTDYMGISIDSYIVWEYKLTDKEVKILDNEINNGYWTKATKDEYEKIKKRFFTYNSDDVSPEKMTENIYYCLLRPSTNEVFKILEDNVLLGWHRYIFIYDFETEMYWCVSMSV